MVLLIILLLFIAVFSYYAGCINTLALASRVVFKKNLLAYEKSNLGITRFLRDATFWKLVWFALLTLAKFGFPVLVGGWLMSIFEIKDIGRGFAMLCLMLGNCYPYMNKFKGQPAIIAFVLCSLFLNFELGFAELIIFAGVYIFKKYISLSAMVAALAAIVLSFVIIENTTVTLMLLVCAIAVFIEYRKSIPRLIKKTEKKYVFKKDLGYMFDE